MELKQFKIAVLPLRNKLLNYARKLTDNNTDAEYAVQEKKKKKKKKKTCMDIWRLNLIDNLSLDSVQAACASVTPERLLEEKDEFRLMREIIGTLPPLQQTILRMKDVEEYENEEIAEITGCGAEAIRSNLSRARKKVRDIYQQTIQQRKRRNEA